MKTWIYSFGKLAILLSLNLGLALSQEGIIRTEQSGPERGPLAAGAQLSQEESERLIASTMVSIDEFLRGLSAERRGPPEEAPGAEPETGAAVAETADQVAALESILSAASQVPGPQMSHLLLRFLELRDQSLRITALHWLAARPDIAELVLAKGLTDSDSLMRTVAEQLLFERGVGDEHLAALKAEAQAGREGSLRNLLGPLLRGSVESKRREQ